jgi:hypothetical protein
MTLVEISRYRTVEEAIGSTKGKKVPAFLTKIRRIDGQDVEVMPDGSVYEGRLPVYTWPKKK